MLGSLRKCFIMELMSDSKVLCVSYSGDRIMRHEKIKFILDFQNLYTVVKLEFEGDKILKEEFHSFEDTDSANHCYDH